MTTTELFAKSRRTGGVVPPTVEEHCRDVLKMAIVLWDECECTLSDAIAKPVERLRTDVRPTFLVAAVMHDFMKANSAFQEMLVANKNRKTQPVRHEILGAFQLWKRLREWISRGMGEQQFWSLVWAVGGHHFQMRQRRDGDSDDPLIRTRNIPRRVTLYLGHEQVAHILASARSIIAEFVQGTGQPPALTDSQPLDPLDDSPEGLDASIFRFVRESDRTWKQWAMKASFSARKRDLGVLKVLLIAADIAGSALPRSKDIDTTPDDWIQQSLRKTLNANDLEAIVQENLKGRPPREFQRSVASSEYSVTVVTAGCGNGKTTAAYMWAKKWAVGRKLFFTYPTTGTASAGFEDYLFAQTDLERTLIHGRASVDLQTMWETADIPSRERAQRLESLNAWGQQAIACTVDTVLGLIQNQRRPVFSFPAILHGAFVFDEVHSYDSRMFSELLRFLETFPGVPALIMSASIPPRRLEQLRRVAGDRMNAAPIRGDQKLEQTQRYQIRAAEEERCWDEVEMLLASNDEQNAHKVLWVCNTIRTAVETFKKAKKRFPWAQVLLYHSRYRYRDRVGLQNAVIEEFRYSDDDKTIRKHPRPAIVIATQVCEMSLDISADLLVSAMCPLPSLVQRLGRLNRYATENDPKPAFVFPFSGRPYHEGDAAVHLADAVEKIDELDGVPCSQEMLGTMINGLQSEEELPEYSAWLDGGWQSEQLPAREGDNSITLVRQEDLAGLNRLPNGKFDKNDVIPLTIPMLFQRGFDWTERAAGCPIAPVGTLRYDWDETAQIGEGAAWQRKQ